MKQKRLLGWVIGVPLAVALLITVILLCEPEPEGIGRAEAARSLVLALQLPEELSSWQKEKKSSCFPADELEEWYVPYLDYLYQNGYLDLKKTPASRKMAEGELTFDEAEQMMGALSSSLKAAVGANRGNREKPFPRERWWVLYESVLQETGEQVQKETVLVYGTPKTLENTPAWTAQTNLGRLNFSGLSLDHLLDHELLAYVCKEELIAVLEDHGQKTVYKNVWILDADTETITVYLGEIERQIAFAKPLKQPLERGQLADIHMDGGKIRRVDLKEERISGNVLSVREDAVEIEGYGLLALDQECKVLKIYGEVERKKRSDILVGDQMQEFVVAEGKICAVLTVHDFEADKIRVLLMTDGFSDLTHERVTIHSDAPVTVSQTKDLAPSGSHVEGEQMLEAGESLTLESGDERLAEGRLILTPQPGKEICVDSLTRAQGSPSYAGRLEILDTGDGLALINELYLEEYLEKVVPSEMPASYELEALKAQAVCARTYAYMQIQSNSYSQYGAHVDDSTNFQVYNNTEPSERTRRAVQETYGKLLLYEGKPVSAYYFSTSCGTTTDVDGAWGSDPEKSPYLKSRALQPGGRSLDLTSEDAFSAFIRRTDYPAYDSGFPFYRWSTVTDTEILSRNIEGVGQVLGIRVTERGAGGVAKKLLVTGSEGEKTISGQNAIRAALGDASLTIRRKDGKTTEGWSSLPSGYLAVEKIGATESGAEQFRILGGGYGHGAGMSQNGAQGMAKQGQSYTDILSFFYQGTEITSMEEDER